MEIQVIKIGNSKGIRLSKTILEKYNITDSMELVLEEDHMILKAKRKPRDGWDQAFRKANESNQDIIDNEEPFPDFFEDENLEEWT